MTEAAVAWLGAQQAIGATQDGDVIVRTGYIHSGDSLPLRMPDGMADPNDIAYYLAKGDGVSDDTAAMQIALARGGRIRLRAGANYRVAGSLSYVVAGTTIYADGPSSTTITFDNGTADGITCDGLNGCGIENVKLTGAGKTGGSFVTVTGGSYLFKMERVYWNNGWNGLNFFKVNSARVINCDQGGGMAGTYGIRFAGDASFKSDVLVLRSVGLANAGGPSTWAAILWDSYAHTLELDDVRIVRPGYGILTQRSTGSDATATPSFLNAAKVEIDFPTKEAIRLDYMNDAWITNLYANGGGVSTEHGVYIGAACSSIRINSARVSGMAKHGILVAGANTLINGIRAYSNSAGASGTYSAVYVDATATDFVISGYDLGKSSGETQKYGLEIAAGASRYAYGAGLVNGNVTGQISAQTDLEYRVGGTFRHAFKSEGGTHMQIGGSANPVANYLRVAGAAAAGHPTILAEGSDTNIDITLTPKGTGLLRFGTVTASGDVPVNGSVSIRSSAGAIIKLATVA